MCFTTAYSQPKEVKVTWNPEQKITTGKSEKEQSYNLGSDLSGGFYTLREKYKYSFGQITKVKRFIEHFDSNGDLMGSEKIIIEKENSKRFFDGVYFNQGNMYLVTNSFRSEDKQNVLSVQTINPETLLVEDDIRNIAEVPYKFEFYYWYKHYTIKVVNNKIYALHYGPVKETKQALLGIFVFDKDFIQLWQHKRKLDYKEKLFKLNDYDIDTDGTVRVMATIYKEKKRAVRNGKPNYEYRFFVFSNEGEELIEHTISISDMFITRMRFYYRPNGDIVCVGFYTNENHWFKSNPIAGAFYVAIDPETTNIKMENHKAFSKEILSGSMSAENDKKSNQFKSFDIRKLHFLDDGSSILLAEEATQFETNMSFTFSSTSTSNTQYSSYYTTTTTTHNINWTNYHFDRILVVKFNPDGNIEWVNIIPKDSIRLLMEVCIHHS